MGDWAVSAWSWSRTNGFAFFHDFYRAGEETEFRFDIKETRRKGHDFKDFICPDSIELFPDYFKLGERYGRVLFLREYASYIKDSMVAEMTDLNRNLMMSIDVVPVPTDEAVREAESRLLGVETNATNWQRRQNANNNFSAQLPYDIEQQRKEMKEFLDDLTTRDQRMMFAVLTMVHTADTKGEQLDNDTGLLTTARKHLCQFGVLKFQQLDGMNTVMPLRHSEDRTPSAPSPPRALLCLSHSGCRTSTTPKAFTTGRMSFPRI